MLWEQKLFSIAWQNAMQFCPFANRICNIKLIQILEAISGLPIKNVNGLNFTRMA